MKVLISILFAFFLCGKSSTAFSISDGTDSSTKLMGILEQFSKGRTSEINDFVSLFLAQHLLDFTVKEIKNSAEPSPKFPVLPELPDYICLNGSTELVPLLDFFWDALNAQISIEAGVLSDTHIQGLDTVKDDAQITLPVLVPLGIDYKVDIGLLKIITGLAASVHLQQFDFGSPPQPTGNITAQGTLTELNVEKAFVTLSTQIRALVPPLKMLELDLDFGLESISLLGVASYKIGDEDAVDLDGELGPPLYDFVRQFWDTNKESILNTIMCLFDFAVVECSLEELLNDPAGCIQNPLDGSGCLAGENLDTLMGDVKQQLVQGMEEILPKDVGTCPPPAETPTQPPTDSTKPDEGGPTTTEEPKPTTPNPGGDTSKSTEEPDTTDAGLIEVANLTCILLLALSSLILV